MCAFKTISPKGRVEAVSWRMGFPTRFGLPTWPGPGNVSTQAHRCLVHFRTLRPESVTIARGTAPTRRVPFTISKAWVRALRKGSEDHTQGELIVCKGRSSYTSGEPSIYRGSSELARPGSSSYTRRAHLTQGELTILVGASVYYSASRFTIQNFCLLLEFL